MSEYDLSESEILCTCCDVPKKHCFSQVNKIANLEKERDDLKANWEELKTQLKKGVDDYKGTGINSVINVVKDIIKEMKKLEGGEG